MIIVSPKNIEKLKSRDLVNLECEYCQKYFKRAKNQVQAVLNGSKKVKLKYCSRHCQFETQKTKTEVECKQCTKAFLKNPSQIKNTKNNFCSQSCAASWNNKHSDRTYGPEKTVFYHCKTCNIEIKYGHIYCKSHRIESTHNHCLTCDIKIAKNSNDHKNHKTIYKDILDRTITEAEDTNGRQANKYRAIRDSSRGIAKRAGLLESCKICGYTKHIVCCHIKEISSYSKTTLVKKINKLTNLIGLCNNHHWEMDHGLLSNEDKAKL